MRRLTRETCDMLVRIPMGGQVESLNVSVAAGVCLFESVRRRASLPERGKQDSPDKQRSPREQRIFPAPLPVPSVPPPLDM